jgi:hypothetical protein
MKSLLLAATVVAGMLVTADSADAQRRYRRGAVYSTPTYSTYSTYSTPTYSTYSYPTYSSGEVIQSSYYTPSYTYPSGSVIQSGYYTPSSSYPMYNNGYYNNGYYNNGYNNGYNNNYSPGINITPSGVNWGGQRIWRW